MTATELATYLVGPSLPHLAGQVGRWLSTNRGFRSFADTCKDRIRKKLRDAGGPEDRRDIFAEVEFAYFITADPRFKVAYEPYGSSDGRTPDFHVQTDHAGEFNLETKRVRESGATNDLEAVRQAIVDGIRGVPSSLGFCVDILHDDSPLELIARLRRATTAVVAQCVEAIRKSKDTLAPDQDVTLPIAGFGEAHPDQSPRERPEFADGLPRRGSTGRLLPAGVLQVQRRTVGLLGATSTR